MIRLLSTDLTKVQRISISSFLCQDKIFVLSRLMLQLLCYNFSSFRNVLKRDKCYLYSLPFSSFFTNTLCSVQIPIMFVYTSIIECLHDKIDLFCRYSPLNIMLSEFLLFRIPYSRIKKRNPYRITLICHIFFDST